MRNAKSLGFAEFFDQHLVPNTPCILVCDAYSAWPAARTWATAHGTIDRGALLQQFARQPVPVSVCRCPCKESCTIPCELPFDEYLQNHLDAAKDDHIVYLKDWHCALRNPDYAFYSVPEPLGYDWLNPFSLTTTGDDYRFVYLGPKGSGTALHCDVLGSYSWSTNIAGRKKWIMFYPGRKAAQQARRVFERLDRAGLGPISLG
eukprot:m.287340 g.287340  ORF g.287340 m.287340 type:complete len:204 (+) comp22929_c1_seq10:726-1337(+)